MRLSGWQIAELIFKGASVFGVAMWCQITADLLTLPFQLFNAFIVTGWLVLGLVVEMGREP